MTDIEFDRLLTSALWLAAEEDYDLGAVPDEEIAIPTQIARKMRKLIHNPIGYVRRLRRPIYLRALRTAAAILVALSVALGAAMAVPQARAAIVDFVRSWLNDRTEYKIIGAPETPLGEWTIGYIPAGFVLVEENINDSLISLKYVDENSNRLVIKITGTSSKHTVDNEHSIFYEITINGNDADVYETNDEEHPNHIIVYAEEEKNVISIQAETNISELIKVAESIVPQ